MYCSEWEWQISKDFFEKSGYSVENPSERSAKVILRICHADERLAYTFDRIRVNDVRFEYEITADEYVACQLLLYKLKSSARKRIGYALAWFIPGAAFVFVGWDKGFFAWNLANTLLVSLGLVWIFFGVLTFFPSWKPRLSYQRSALAGKKFQAEVNEQGFEVTGESRSWRVQWPGVAFKAEDDKVFMLYAEPIVFSFGKKYLSEAQQHELRRLAGLPPR